MAFVPGERKSLLSSQARVQAPFVKVTIGTYTFGVYNKKKLLAKDENGFFAAYGVQYPNYVQSLQITKINGQVNQYTLSIAYPVTANDDPNFFEKVFSSVSKTRKIIFSYGDSSMPSYIYKDEEAIITNVQTSFNFGSSGTISTIINYTVSAVSGAALGKSSCFTFINSGKKKPSTEIKRLLTNDKYGLKSLFTGMNSGNINKLIAGDDAKVELESKRNISALDYVSYLVGCMIPEGTSKKNISKDIYTLVLYDDTSYDRVYSDREVIDGTEIKGPYFKVSRVSYATKRSDAYEIDIGYNTSTIVTGFTINNNENYSLYYDYNSKLQPEQYVRRINDEGEWEDVYAPALTSKNPEFETRAEDIVWYTKVTQFPVSGTITIQGLLRPATLMQYVRLNIIFPGGHKHITSGLYIVTKQIDTIDGNGYKTQLTITKLSGDETIKTYA